MTLPPTRCFSCGRTLADKYLAYKRLVARESGGSADAQPGVYYYTTGTVQKSAHGRALDALHITSGCCRTHMLCQPQT